MAYELGKGDECMLSGDFKSEGKPAFNRGDIVRIQDISPDRLQPGNKYLVDSPLLGMPVRLPGMILKRISCPECGERLAPAGAGGFADSCPCGWSDVESSHAKSVQRLSDFHENLSRRRSRTYARTEQNASTDSHEGETPFEVGLDAMFTPTEPDPVQIEKPAPHTYACPRCGTGILVATECPHCGWRYQASAKEPEKKAARVTRDIVVEGAVAFKAGDWVVIEEENPDPQRPEYKYVVLSLALKKRFLLSDTDLSI